MRLAWRVRRICVRLDQRHGPRYLRQAGAALLQVRAGSDDGELRQLEGLGGQDQLHRCGLPRLNSDGPAGRLEADPLGDHYVLAGCEAGKLEPPCRIGLDVGHAVIQRQQ